MRTSFIFFKLTIESKNIELFYTQFNSCVNVVYSWYDNLCTKIYVATVRVGES
jgi:hypothetical protein